MEGQTKKKAMPIGIEDFKKLRENYYFVDKTRFIRELLDNHGAVTLITRPRRFGKTLTLSMLQYFFTLEHAEENRKLFEDLDIGRAGEKYMREQGTRPVVFLTLKEVRERNFGSTIIILKELLCKLYEAFPYLKDSPALPASAKAYIEEITTSSCGTEKLQFALVNLMENLEKHHHQKPILLLDEYDAPIQAAWEHGYYEECISFMRGFLGAALKTNPALDFAVLTGITRISKESIFSGLNNLDVCSVFSDSYSDILGFTQEEVRQLTVDLGIEDSLPEIRSWYDGYLFGSKEIYNPWSVINFVKEGCKFGPYWINVSGNSILHVLLEQVNSRRRKELEKLLQGQPVDATIDEGVIYSDIRKNSNALYMMLLTTGYLKAVDAYWDPTGEQLPCCKLLIPNREIRIAYRKEVLSLLAGNMDSIVLREMLSAMLEGDVDTFRQDLGDILLNHVSLYDAAYPESFYHGMMLGFSVLMEGSCRVESNQESGYGRFDLAFFPEKEGAPGVILEFKTAKTEDELEARAKEALQQIEERAYETEMRRCHVPEIWKYGIAFCGKRVWMERG